MDLITCNAFLGGTKQVTRDRLRFRPAVYGLIMHEEKVLLMNTILTGRYSLPGGGIELGEQIEETLRREVLEETGLDVEVGRFCQSSHLFLSAEEHCRFGNGIAKNIGAWLVHQYECSEKFIGSLLKPIILTDR